MHTGVLLQIPAFPPVATKLLQLSFDDETGTASLIRLLRSDPALSAEIIRHANSALFTVRTEVATLDRAVTLLGVRRIRMLALAAISRTYVKGLLMVEDLRAYWRYSVACALVAERIAAGQNVPEDTAYAAALLHDLGCLGLMVAYPADYPRLLQTMSEALEAGLPFDLRQQERYLLGMDRYQAGEWLARKWNLPEDLRMAAGPYDFAAGHDPDLIRIVRTASRLANSLGFAMILDPSGPTYEQIRESLLPETACLLPRQGIDLRAHIEKEIALLDWDPCAFEQESAAQEFLHLAESGGAEDATPASPASPGRRVWPALVTTAVLLILLGLLKLAAG